MHRFNYYIFKASIYFSLVILLVFVGCAGRQPTPILIVQKGDEKKSCQKIDSELKAIDKEINLHYAEVKDTEDYNLGIGVVGSLFPPIVPFSIFSDIRKADEVELNALQKRYNHLVKTERQSGCGFEHSFRPVREVKSILH